MGTSNRTYCGQIDKLFIWQKPNFFYFIGKEFLSLRNPFYIVSVKHDRFVTEQQWGENLPKVSL